MLGVFLVGALDELYRLFHAFEICFVLLSLLAGFAQGFKKSGLFHPARPPDPPAPPTRLLPDPPARPTDRHARAL